MDETEDHATREESVAVVEPIGDANSIAEEKQEMFDFFGKSHMMMLAGLFAKSGSPWRFNEIRDETEISQTTLSARLSDLVDEGLITRRSYDEIPPRVEYEATERLLVLGPVLQDIFEWWRDSD